MNEYTTVNGDVIKLRPISAKIRDVLSSKYKMPLVPTYSVTNVVGEVECHPHDETTLETDEDKAVWEQHKKDIVEANTEYSELVIDTYIKFGTNYSDFSPLDDGWAELQEDYGLSVPLEPKARQLHYFITEILTSDSDLRNVMANIRALSSQGRMLSLEEAEESFRSTVEDKREDKSGRVKDYAVVTIEGTETGSGPVGS